MPHERAGQPADPEDLVDVARLVTAYYALHPDPAEPGQRVAFGTSGHRGSSLTTAFNEDHIAATSQAICEYRAEQGTDGPALPRRRHPRAVRAGPGHRAGGVRRQRRDRAHRHRGRLHADARRLARDPHPQPRPHLGARRRRGGHPVAQPARRRRLQVQPAERRPGRLRGDLLDPGPGQRADRGRPQGRPAASRTPGRSPPTTTGRYDFLGPYVDRPAARARPGRGPRRRGADRRRPAGRRVGRRTGAGSPSGTGST